MDRRYLIIRSVAPELTHRFLAVRSVGHNVFKQLFGLEIVLDDYLVSLGMKSHEEPAAFLHRSHNLSTNPFDFKQADFVDQIDGTCDMLHRVQTTMRGMKDINRALLNILGCDWVSDDMRLDDDPDDDIFDILAPRARIDSLSKLTELQDRLTIVADRMYKFIDDMHEFEIYNVDELMWDLKEIRGVDIYHGDGVIWDLR